MTWADLLEGSRHVITAIMDLVAAPVLIYFLVINTSLLVLIGLAAWEFLRHNRRTGYAGREETLAGQLGQGVSVVVPAYNEEAVIVTSVQAMLSLRYPRHEVIVVDDGSTDAMFAQLRAAFDLVPVQREVPSDLTTRGTIIDVHVPRDGRTRLVVVRKENSGRSDAINVGINAAAEPLVMFVDADSILDPDALIVVTKPFADDPTRVVATGGVIRAANGCKVVDGRIVEVNLAKPWIVRIQVVEYLRAFLLGRTGWSRFGALILISGAFGMFRRDVLVEIGGLDPDSIGEDFELVMRIHRHMIDNHRDYRVQFVAEPVSWTEVPVTVTVLRSQRKRWHRGLWETLWKYRRMLFNPRYGKVGLVAIPYYWVFELIAPLVELVGLVLVAAGFALGVVNVTYALLFMAVAYGYAILVTLVAIAIDELAFHKYTRWRDLGAILLVSVLENVGYRQATAWWRMEGWWSSLVGKKAVWGTMTRQGFDDGSSPATAVTSMSSDERAKSSDE
jgi:cellulose synthase/poly-beta-1,6-N-acetylglucosamine synthase-like glycosyltransferase